MTTALPTAIRANEIQRAYVLMDGNAPYAIRERIIEAQRELPMQHLVKRANGEWIVMVMGSQLNSGCPEVECVELARRHGVQTALRWDAGKREWFSVLPVESAVSAQIRWINRKLGHRVEFNPSTGKWELYNAYGYAGSFETLALAIERDNSDVALMRALDC